MNSNSTDPKEVRNFGTVALVLFGAVFALSLGLSKPAAAVFFGCLAMTGAGLIAMPSRLMGVYKTWLKIAHTIGTVITMVVLTLGFYLVISPSAILKRIFGGRPLPLKPDRNAATYWVTRDELSQPKERYVKRY